LLYSRSNLSDVLPPARTSPSPTFPAGQTLYAAGRLLHIFPVSISTHGLALNITCRAIAIKLDSALSPRQHHSHVQVLCDMLRRNSPPSKPLRGACRSQERDRLAHDLMDHAPEK